MVQLISVGFEVVRLGTACRRDGSVLMLKLRILPECRRGREWRRRAAGRVPEDPGAQIWAETPSRFIISWRVVGFTLRISAARFWTPPAVFRA